jgi:hypothetical protein
LVLNSVLLRQKVLGFELLLDNPETFLCSLSKLSFCLITLQLVMLFVRTLTHLQQIHFLNNIL